MIAPAASVSAALSVAQSSAGDAASSQVSLAIMGFIVLATVIALVTVVFWRLTRPEPERVQRHIPRVVHEPASPDAIAGPDTKASADTRGSADRVDPSGA